MAPNICGFDVQNFVDVSLLASSGEWRKKTVQIAGVRQSGRETGAKTMLYIFDFLGFLKVNTTVQNTSTLRMEKAVPSETLVHIYQLHCFMSAGL